MVTRMGAGKRVAGVLAPVVVLAVLSLTSSLCRAAEAGRERPTDWFRVAGLVNPSVMLGGRASIAELFFREGFAWTIFQGAYVSDFGPCDAVGDSGRFVIAATTEPAFRFVDTGRHLLSLGLMVGFGHSFGCDRKCGGGGTDCDESQGVNEFSGTSGLYFSPVLRYRLYLGRIGLEASLELPLVLGAPLDQGKGAWFDWPMLGIGLGL